MSNTSVSSKPVRSLADTILLAIALVSSLLCLVAVLAWAGPCTGVLDLANGNATPMRCLYTSKIILLIAAAIVLVAGKSLITGAYKWAAILLLSCALIVVTFESPIGIGVCKSEMMCWTMAFWARLCGGISAVAALGLALRPLLGKQVR